MNTKKLKDYVGLTEFVPTAIRRAKATDLRSQLFIIDMTVNYEEWGDEMFISPKQIKWLLDLAI